MQGKSDYNPEKLLIQSKGNSTVNSGNQALYLVVSEKSTEDFFSSNYYTLQEIIHVSHLKEMILSVSKYSAFESGDFSVLSTCLPDLLIPEFH